MTPASTTLTDEIREHYDQLSPLYQTLWGEHIHHGYWLEDESPAQAQENLILQLAADAAIAPGSRVADLGCGIGGSACWLARHRGCSVVGITISAVQARLAAAAAMRQGLEKQVRFEIEDLNDLGSFSACGRFDSAWILESSEHIADKRRFLQDIAGILRPQGTIGIGAWVAGEPPRIAEQADLLERVCAAMLCPGLASIAEYVEWMQQSGFEVGVVRDITTNIRKTWLRCAELIDLPHVQGFLNLAPPPVRRFAAAFPDMVRAYETGAMRYALMSGILRL